MEIREVNLGVAVDAGEAEEVVEGVVEVAVVEVEVEDTGLEIMEEMRALEAEVVVIGKEGEEDEAAADVEGGDLVEDVDVEVVVEMVFY